MDKTELITAIRNSKRVGNGSCSVIDECWTDAEIAKELNERKIKTIKKAVAWAVFIHNTFEGRLAENPRYR